MHCSFHRPKGQPNNQRTHVAPASPEIRLGTPGSIAPSSGPVLPSSTAENEVMRRYAMKYHSQVQELLNTLPSDMILLFKTNDCLRHLDSLLGAPVNTITGELMLI